MFINEFGKEAFDEIITKINWIEKPFSLRVFCYLNDILEKPLCKICGDDVKFNATELHFQTYCSNPCRFKDLDHIKTIRDKTNIEKYGAANVFASKHGMDKIKNTNLSKYGTDNYCKTDEYKNRVKSGDIKRPYCGDKISATIKRKYFNNLPNRYNNLIPLFKLEDYKGAHNYDVRYEWKCKNCGNIFLHWLNNNYDLKCKSCEKSGTNIEVFVENFLKRYGIAHIKRDRMTLNKLELDFNIPSRKIAIECNGLHWHSDEMKDKNYHLVKTEMCLELGIKLIHIFEDEIETKPRQVENRLRSIFGLNKIKINARECHIQNINHEISSKFLNKYHLQGADIASIRLGLFKGKRLISIMTFSKSRKALGQNLQEGEYELTRFCSIGNVTINGGAQKLLSYFIKNYSPKKIMSFCDRRWSNGELYNKLNFILVKKTDVNYWYVDKTCRKRYHRFTFAKQFLAEKLENFDPALSERENMIINGYKRIYDCGSLKYELTP